MEDKNPILKLEVVNENTVPPPSYEEASSQASDQPKGFTDIAREPKTIEGTPGNFVTVSSLLHYLPHSLSLEFGEVPIAIDCPKCGSRILTKTKKKLTAKGINCSAMLCVWL